MGSVSPDMNKHTNLTELLENENETKLFYLFGYQNPFKLGEEEFELVRDAFWNQSSSPSHSGGTKSDLEMVFTSTSLKIYQMMHPYLIMSFYGVSLSQRILTKYTQLVKLYVTTHPFYFKVFYSFRVLINSLTKS